MAPLKTAPLYKVACQKIGKKTWLNEKHLKRFRALDRKLSGHDIDPETYINTSITIWQSWAEEKGMKIVPINLICGDRAIERYVEMDPVVEDDNYNEIAHMVWGATEYLFRALISGKSLKDAREVLNTDWYPEDWHKLVNHDADLIRKFERETVLDIAERHNISLDFEDVESLATQYLTLMELSNARI